MKRLLVFLALCASVSVPIAAPAQPAPPTAAQQATMDKLHAQAKTAAYAALTPAHAAGVTAIAAQVAGGTLDRRTAAGQIDALLTPDESKAVLATADKSRADMRAAGVGPPVRPPGAGGPPNGAAAPPPGAGPPGGPGRFRFTAGRYLLLVSMSPDQMRSLQPRARSSSAP